MQIKKDLELKGSFKEMARKGIRFTSYTVEDGAGRGDIRLYAHTKR